MTRRRLQAKIGEWRLARPFRTATVCDDRIALVEVALSEDGCTGRGEAAGVYFRGETAADVLRAIEQVRPAIEGGIGRADLQSLLAPGGARNALDCALWDLEAKLTGIGVAERAGLVPAPVTTVFSIGLGEPAAMASEARALEGFALLKLKLDRDRPLERVAAVRAARPDACLLVDANGSWTLDDLLRWAAPLHELGIALIEQPCPPELDHALAGLDLPVPLCADESCSTRADLDRVAAAFGSICVKLDKTGGLTEAIALVEAAQARGLGVVVGNMLGTSLAMAPLSLLAPRARYVDMDGPLLLAQDRAPGMRSAGALIDPLVPEIWGGIA